MHTKQGWSYEKMYRSGSHLLLEGARWKKEDGTFTAEPVDLSLQMQPWPPKLISHVEMVSPKIEVNHDSFFTGPSLLWTLLPNPYFVLRLDVYHGEICFPENFPIPSCFFSFTSGEKKEEIGSFTVFHDSLEERPFFSLSMAEQGSSILSTVDIEEEPASSIEYLVSLFQPEAYTYIDKIEGSVHLHAEATWDKELAWKNFQAEISCHEMELDSSFLGLTSTAKSVHVSVFADPQVEKGSDLLHWIEAIGRHMQASISLKQAQISLSRNTHVVTFENANGEMACSPGGDSVAHLEGLCLVDSEPNSFSLDASGSVQDVEGGFWLLAKCQFADLQSKEVREELTFSITSSPPEDILLQAEGNAMGSRLFSLSQCLLPEEISSKYKWKRGSIQGKFSAACSLTQISQLQWSQLVCNDIAFTLPHTGYEIEAKSLTTSGEMQRVKEHLVISKGEMRCVKGRILSSSFDTSLQDISCNFRVEEGLLHSSYMEAALYKSGLLKAKMNVQFLDPKEPSFAHLEVSSYLDHIQELLPNEWADVVLSTHTAIHLAADVKKEEDILSLEGRAALAGDEGEEIIDFGLEAPSNEQIFFSLLDGVCLKDWKGWVQSERASSSLLQPLINRLVSDIRLEGYLRFLAQVSPSTVDLCLQVEHCRVSSRAFSFTAPSLGSGPLSPEGSIHCRYDIKENQLHGTFPVKDGALQEKLHGMKIQSIEGFFKVENGKLFSDQVSALFCNTPLQFSLHMDEESIIIESSEIQGKIESLLPLVKAYYPDMSSRLPAIRGEFVIPKQGAMLLIGLHKEDAIVRCKLDMKLQDVSTPCLSSFCVEALCGNISIDSFSHEIKLEGFRGKVATGRDRYPFVLQDMHWGAGSITPFDLQIREGDRIFARIAGTVEDKEGITLSFDEKKTFFQGVQLRPLPIKLGIALPPPVLELRPSVDIQEIVTSREFFQRAFAMPQSILSSLEKVEGVVVGNVRYDPRNEDLSVLLEGKELLFDGKPSPFFLEVHRRNAGWKVDSLRFKEWNVQASLIGKEDKIVVDPIEISCPEGVFAGRGFYDRKEEKLTISSCSITGSMEKLKTTFPQLKELFSVVGDIRAKGSFSCVDLFAEPKWEGTVSLESSLLDRLLVTQKPLHFSFSGKKGAYLGEFALLLQEKMTKQTVAQCFVSEASFHPTTKKGVLSKVNGALSSSLLRSLAAKGLIPEWLSSMRKQEQLLFKGDMQWEGSNYQVQGYLKDGTYYVKDNALDLTQIQLQVDAGVAYLKAQTLIQNKPLWLLAQAPLSQKGSCLVQIKEEGQKEGIVATFSSSGCCEKIQGACRAMDVALQKKSSASKDLIYVGHVQINFAELCPFLPKAVAEPIASLQLGDGYRMEGTFVVKENKENPVQFVGSLQGRQFEVLGYTFGAMQAEVDLSPERCTIEQLKVEDGSGTLTMKSCRILKEEGGWNVFAPLVYVKDFQPSRLSKKEEKPSSAKPFTIRNLSLYDISGYLGEKKSFSAAGSLNFTNIFKKEMSFFDLPFELMKDLGLDLNILTPVSGEVDFYLDSGKCHFKDLRSAYSEGRRSQFFFPTDTSYIDLDGNWHVDLKMKQNVVLKWSESFVLLIRGKLDSPKYSLKNAETTSN